MEDDFVSSLRKLADWYEAHPDLPRPNYTQLYVFIDLESQLEEVKGLLGEFAREMPGTVAKRMDDANYTVSATFGTLPLSAVAPREMVCERRQVGERVIPAT